MTSSPDPPAYRNAADAWVKTHAAIRQRVLDDHMFSVDLGWLKPATLRLQVFTAPGTQPVAVATQTTHEGPSLVNAAERYAAAVWQRHFGDTDQPPIWIQNLLMECSLASPIQAVRFTVTGRYTLTSPRWMPLTAEHVRELVGSAVDLGRGQGYVPREPELEPVRTYTPVWVARLPRPDPFRQPDCMPSGVPWWRRFARQIIPRRRGRDCCWYHRGDWHRISTAAIRLGRQAHRAHIVEADDIATYVLDLARAERMTAWELEALGSLLNDAPSS